MSWIKDAVNALSQGKEVQVRPLGGSMRGRIESGQLVTLEPSKLESVVEEDVVLIRWKGSHILHIVKEIRESKVLIGNNIGKINGWTEGNNILGKVIKVEE